MVFHSGVLLGVGSGLNGKLVTSPTMFRPPVPLASHTPYAD